MSTLKVTNLQHPSAASANVTLDASGNADFNGKNLAGVASVNGGQLGARNRIKNGAMTISQRGTSTSTSGAYLIDRWKCQTDSALTVEQVSDAPAGFTNSLKFTNTTASSSATSYREILQYIEAQDLANSGWDYTSSSAYMAFSFWVKSSVAQTMSVLFRADDTGSNNYFSRQFTINSANTWERVTMTIFGDSGLTINNDNGSGMSIFIIPFYGTNYASASSDGAWASSEATAVKTFDSTWASTTNSTIQITGVQLEIGDTATDFEHESYGTTLQKAQRYFEKITYPTSQYFAVGFVNNGSRGRFTLTYTHKRTTPSVSFTGSNLVYYSGSTNDSSTLTAEAPGLDSTRVNYELDNNTNQANGAAVGVLAVSGGVVMDVDAEL